MSPPDPWAPPVAPLETAPEPGTLAPVAPDERIDALDVLRGFALLGIFLMNVEFFARPMQDINGPGIDPSFVGMDWWADAFVYFFVQSKFWTLFSLLFGMGFAVMIDRAIAARRPFVPAYLRRSLMLLFIGAVHALLIWSGDILVSYAIGALLLLASRTVFQGFMRQVGVDPGPLGAGKLAAMGAALYAVPLGLILMMGVSVAVMPPGMAAEHAGRQHEATVEVAQVRAQAVESYRDGDYGDAVRQRVVDTAESLDPGNMAFFLPMLLGVFVLGMAVLRSGMVAQPQAHLRKLRLGRNLGLPIGFAVMAISVSFGTGMSMEDFDFKAAIQVVAYLVAGLVLALAYGATIVLAIEGRFGPALRQWIAPAGRMALTNYLMQSVLGTLLFYNYGFGLWGQVGRATQVAFVLLVFTAQLLLSRWWLERFRFGPVEWVWRAATYARVPEFRRLSPA